LKFFDRYFDKKNNPIPKEKEKDAEKRFVGVLFLKFTAKYGINMQDIKTYCDEDKKKLYVAGAKVRFLGTEGFPVAEWQMAMSFKRSWPKRNDWTEDNSVQKLREDMREELRMDTVNGLQFGPKEFNWLEKSLQEKVNNFIKYLVMPNDNEYEIELVEHFDQKYKTLEHFIDL